MKYQSAYLIATNVQEKFPVDEVANDSNDVEARVVEIESGLENEGPLLRSSVDAEDAVFVPFEFDEDEIESEMSQPLVETPPIQTESEVNEKNPIVSEPDNSVGLTTATLINSGEMSVLPITAASEAICTPTEIETPKEKVEQAASSSHADVWRGYLQDCGMLLKGIVDSGHAGIYEERMKR